MKTSCGLLMFRDAAVLEVLLAHPGGPYFRNKDDGAWGIPKGELEPDEDPVACARREFQEETGIEPVGELLPLGELTQRGGKRVLAWALRAPSELVLQDPPPSNTFELEWPPRSGKRVAFPEIDRIAFFDLAAARQKILVSQLVLIERLEAQLGR